MLLTSVLGGCATAPAAVCGPISGEQKMVAGGEALERAFGAVPAGYYRHVEHETVDSRGDLTITYHRVGPVTEAQPADGEGERLTVVVQRCTGKLLRYYRP